MNDPKQANAQTSAQNPASSTGAPSAPQSQNPSRDSVTFTPNDAFEPPPPQTEKLEDLQDAAHEKTLDIDSELKDADLSHLDLKVVQPLAPNIPPTKKVAPPPPAPAPIPVPPPAPIEQPKAPAPITPPPAPIATPAQPQPTFTPPGFIPAESQKNIPVASVPPPPASAPTPTQPTPMSETPPAQTVEVMPQQAPASAAPKTASIHEPRSFASLTPLMMREPVEPQLAKEAPQLSPQNAVQQPEQPVPTLASTPLSASMRAPIPIQQEIPGHEIIPGAVSKQPEAPAQSAKAADEDVPKNQSVLDKIREQSASVLHPLRTYQTDAQVSIRENNTSLVSAAAAEERRRAQASLLVRPAYKPTTEAPKHHYLRTILLVLGTSLFLAGGIGTVAYVLIPKSVDLTNQLVATEHPIEVDESVELPFAGLSHDQLQEMLVTLRDKTTLSLGLVREIYLTLPTEDGKRRLATVEEVLPKLAPHIPSELVRTLSPSFLIGVHIYDGNQGFIILKTTSYEQAYSSMLAWEGTMHDDLMPFMDRRPGPRLSTDTVSTSTPAKVLPGEFVDVVVRNHDARALYDRFGNLIFLYSFLDRNTIFIGTNEFTLSEAVSRTSGR